MGAMDAKGTGTHRCYGTLIFERTWQSGEGSGDWKKVNVTPVFKKGEGGSGQSASPGTARSGDQFNHVEDKKVIRSSQYGFTKGKSFLTSLITFHVGTTGWRYEGRAVGVAYLDFRRAFSKISHDILTGKLREGELDEWIVRWIENWQSSEGCYQWHRLKTCH